MMDLEQAVEAIQLSEETDEVKAFVRTFFALPGPTTKREANKIMSILCFHNLAFCCGKDNTCPCRDAVLNVLGISWRDFVKTKVDAIWRLMRVKV